MAKNWNTGYRKPMFKNRIFHRSSIRYGLLSLLIFFMGIFLFPNPAQLATITADNIVEMTNQERQEKNIPPLHINTSLEQAAEQKAKAILREQRFEHELQNQDFSHWIEKTDYDYKYIGENLAIDFTEAEKTMDAWMTSDSHRQNILNNKYKEIGISVLKGEFRGQETRIVVQIFGAQKERTTLEQNSSKSDTSSPTPEKEQHPSSSTLQIASISSTPTGKLLFLGDVFSNIWQHELPGRYKYSIFALMFILIFSYFYLFSLLSAVFKKHTCSIKSLRKY